MKADLNQGDKSWPLSKFVYFPIPGRECVFYCYYIDLKGTDDDKPSTEIITKTIKTADMVKSNNNITLNITKTTKDGVYATFTTTNSDTYFVGIARKKVFDWYKNHPKRDLVDLVYFLVEDVYVLNNYQIEFFSGNQNITPEGRFSCDAGGDYYLVYCPFNRETGIGGEVKVEPFSTPKK